MRLLVDSHVLLWWLDGSRRMSGEAVSAIRSRGNEVYVSVVSLWELAIKQSIGKLHVDVDLWEHVREQQFDELPILGAHAATLSTLPLHHRDPFDRMLIAQARCENLILVTSDPKIDAYGVPVLRA